MVHALQLVHHLLQPGGILVDVHNLPVPPVLEVHSAGAELKAGWLRDSSEFADERAALNALIEIVSQGHFLLEDERDFKFKIHAADMPELQAYLAGWWESVFIPEITLKRTDSILKKVGPDSEVVLSMPARMTKLCAV